MPNLGSYKHPPERSSLNKLEITKRQEIPESPDQILCLIISQTSGLDGVCIYIRNWLVGYLAI